uniref:Uncharacterized protein n=1 Tax=Mandrillus leucophaeus TaxID=9568 RepID=A0A2K5XUP2_MANLE
MLKTLMEKTEPQIVNSYYTLLEVLIKIGEYICWNNGNGDFSLKVPEGKGSHDLQETLPPGRCFPISPHPSLPLFPFLPSLFLSLSLCPHTLASFEH